MYLLVILWFLVLLLTSIYVLDHLHIRLVLHCAASPFCTSHVHLCSYIITLLHLVCTFTFLPPRFSLKSWKICIHFHLPNLDVIKIILHFLWILNLKESHKTKPLYPLISPFSNEHLSHSTKPLEDSPQVYLLMTVWQPRDKNCYGVLISFSYPLLLSTLPPPTCSPLCSLIFFH